jgi:hypothetical protein
MANQPNFDMLTQYFHNIGDQIGLIANLPAVNDRQLAQNRHDELMGAIRGINTQIDGINTRIDGINTRIDSLDTRVNDMGRNLNARLDGLETRSMAA